MIPRQARPGAAPAPGRVPLATWAGIECTYNRVGDRFHDQLARSGHYARPDDIDRIADLGVTALRYPILWERHAHDGEAAWRVTDRMLERIRARGLEPIVTLVHHGSGPRHVRLTRRDFATGLAAHAAEVARRHPWITHWTPINEPLTTARFSLLYGHWFPHLRSDTALATGMLVQTLATREAMRAIRAVVPGARLVQTEDLGKAHATPPLLYQADRENERRWLTVDLLTGRVDPSHPWHARLARTDGHAALLDDLAADPCPPDLVGVNHYVTSERFLDHRLERWPAATHGGNERHAYADVEAVRAADAVVAGPRTLLVEAWERYGLPLAVTEVHLGCTREQQLRWWRAVHEAVHGARDAGADVRAITAWAALGSFDWSTLCTRDAGHYEPGLFDVRSSPPRPTALADVVAAAAQGEATRHPALAGPGWWELGARLSAPLHGRAPATPALHLVHDDDGPAHDDARPVLVVGAGGTLGRATVAACAERALACVALRRDDCDVTDADAIRAVLALHRPWAVVNCAGWVRVDDAEDERDGCWAANVDGAAALARGCAERDIAFATFSSDLVFDGTAGRAYVESDAPSPLGTYGRSKAAAEAAVHAAHPGALVVRTAAFFGVDDDWNFVTGALRAIARDEPVVAGDEVVSPTFVPDLVDATLDLLCDGAAGLWHLANAGAVSWGELATLAADGAGLDAPRLVPPDAVAPRRAARPRHVPLDSERGRLLPPLEHALARYLATRCWERPARLHAAPTPPAAFPAHTSSRRITTDAPPRTSAG